MPKKIICGNCNKIIKGKSHKIDAGKRIVDLCSSCFDELDSAIKRVTTNEKYLVAIILGLIAGIAGAVAWFAVVVVTEYQIGFVAIVVGWVVGLGVYFGSGKKKSVRLQVIGSIISLLAILFGEYLIANYYLVKYLIEDGSLASFTLLSPYYVMIVVFKMIPEGPLTLLFWAIAVWVTYSYLKPPKLKMAASFE